MHQFATNALSRRERQILLLIAEGLSQKEIAAQLGLSFHTVSAHRANMAKKTGRKAFTGNVVLLLREHFEFVPKSAGQQGESV